MKKNSSIFIMILGLLLFIVGLSLKVPGTDLTTYSLLDGTENYSSIREYVGGDAYNYIIGASLVAGKIAGKIAMKSVFIATGLVIFTIGLIAYSGLQNTKERSIIDSNDAKNVDNSSL